MLYVFMYHVIINKHLKNDKGLNDDGGGEECIIPVSCFTLCVCTE